MVKRLSAVFESCFRNAFFIISPSFPTIIHLRAETGPLRKGSHLPQPRNFLSRKVSAPKCKAIRRFGMLASPPAHGKATSHFLAFSTIRVTTVCRCNWHVACSHWAPSLQIELELQFVEATSQTVCPTVVPSGAAANRQPSLCDVHSTFVWHPFGPPQPPTDHSQEINLFHLFSRVFA